MSRTPPPETVGLVSFDGGVADRCKLERPDRYWMLERTGGETHRIARGGGYSYAAASFGSGSLVTDMTRFNRFLAFDRESNLIEVEAGMTLGELLDFTLPRGLALSVQPGYPAITIGGCIAANVHGKNPHREGTFASLVSSFTLYHPRHGTLHVEPARSPEAFDLTVGGFGLTGLVLTAKLKLQSIPGFTASVERIEAGSLSEALETVRSVTKESAFAYTWHDGVPRSSTFGRGFVYRGEITGDERKPTQPFRYRRLDAGGRGALPFSVLASTGARLLTAGFWFAERLQPKTVERPLVDALFPFARRYHYFLLFGRPGLVEFQTIVPSRAVDAFLADLEASLLRSRPSCVMISMKLFRGEQKLLRFEGQGVCLTLDFARTRSTTEFLPALDAMCAEAGAIPNVIKDSRLSLDTVRRCYPQYEEFRDRLRAFDPSRLYRSELSQRLGL